MAKVNSRCLHYFRPPRGTPTRRLHTGLCKFVQNISSNILSLEKCTDLKLGEVAFLSISISYHHNYPLNGFRIIFLLRDSASQEYMVVCRHEISQCSRVQLDISRVSATNMYYSVYYINIAMTFLTIFQRFPSTFRRLPIISENFRRRTDVSIILENVEVLFKGLCNYSKGDK